MSDRAHDFDSTCNCGPCLADRGIEPMSEKAQARKAIKDGGRDSIYAPLHSHYPPARPKPKLPEGLIDRHGHDRPWIIGVHR